MEVGSRTKASLVRALESPKVVLFGDSHTNALQRAAERRIAKGGRVPVVIHRLLKTHWKSGQIVGDTSFEQFLDIIRALEPHDLVLSMVGGNQHAVYSTIQHPKPFDFLDPADNVDASPQAELIPYRMLAGHFAEGLARGDGKSLESIRSATSAHVIHIMAPPPKASNEFIEEYHETVFAREGIATQGVSSPSLRLKFWRLQVRSLESLCSKLGIETMWPPPSACEDGFLAKDYYSKDATHANPSYGELVLCQIEDWLRNHRSQFPS